MATIQPFDHNYESPHGVDANSLFSGSYPEQLQAPEPEAILAVEPLDSIDNIVYLPQIEDSETKPNVITRGVEWIKRQKVKLALGTVAASTTITLATDPLSGTMEQLKEAAPWVATGVLGSETAFIAGLAVMSAGIGNKIGNPFKLRSKLPEIAKEANDSLVFKTGFWLNAFGAIGTAAVASAGVISELPVKSWGVLSFAFLEMGSTIALRKIIWGGIKSSVVQQEKKNDD